MKRYVIECPARCAERGCTDHAAVGSWRQSRRLPVGTGRIAARVALHRHRRRFPRSGPYRLRAES